MPDPIIEIKETRAPHLTAMARRDWAITTRQKHVEPPDWYEHTETGDKYHGIYGAVSWPTEIQGEEGRSRIKSYDGYVAIIGVAKDRGDLEAENAPFKMLEEAESPGIEHLVLKCLELRKKYGYQPGKPHMSTFFGDPERSMDPGR